MKLSDQGPLAEDDRRQFGTRKQSAKIGMKHLKVLREVIIRRVAID